MTAVSAMINTIAMSPSRAAYYATAEGKVGNHPERYPNTIAVMAASVMANALLGSRSYIMTGGT